MSVGLCLKRSFLTKQIGRIKKWFLLTVFLPLRSNAVGVKRKTKCYPSQIANGFVQNVEQNMIVIGMLQKILKKKASASFKNNSFSFNSFIYRRNCGVCLSARKMLFTQLHRVMERV